jgi:hypothetical protein
MGSATKEFSAVVQSRGFFGLELQFFELLAEGLEF